MKKKMLYFQNVLFSLEKYIDGHEKERKEEENEWKSVSRLIVSCFFFYFIPLKNDAFLTRDVNDWAILGMEEKENSYWLGLWLWLWLCAFILYSLLF